MDRTFIAIGLIFSSLIAFAQYDDMEPEENKYAYLTIDFGYIGSFYEDEGL